LSDPDQSRPSLPDPQRDRHVAFVGGGPDTGTVSGTAGPAGPAGPDLHEATTTSTPSTWATALPVATTLPPEAWAPRSSTRESSSSTPSWSRDPGPAPSVLATPPVRPATRRRRPRWPALLLVPLLIGVANNQDDGSQTDGCTISDDTGTYECSSYDGTAGGASGMGAEQGVVGVWADDVTGSTKPLAPLLQGSPKVSPVPADATVLRVEIVSSTDGVASRGDPPSAPLQAQVDTSAGGMPIDAWDQGTPHALDVHLDERPTDVQVSVTVTAGSGTVQCRVYAGSTLVAVDTSTATAMCTPEL
jgi:hypothetical protein